MSVAYSALCIYDSGSFIFVFIKTSFKDKDEGKGGLICNDGT
jgi:hypothetical protein